jgi:hypothetical protein
MPVDMLETARQVAFIMNCGLHELEQQEVAAGKAIGARSGIDRPVPLSSRIVPRYPALPLS